MLKQITENFGETVAKEFPNLEILKYFPYGPETTWSSWICGTIDLRDWYKEPHNKKKTEKDYVLSIIEETARAMSYMTTHLNGCGGDGQRIAAFGMWHLFHCGWMEWTKEPLVGKNNKEIAELIEFHRKRSDLVHNTKKDTLKDFANKKQMEKYLKTKRKNQKHHLKEYGVFEVKHFPLTQFSNTCHGLPKILYTKQELAAIDLMVMDAFENLC